MTKLTEPKQIVQWLLEQSSAHGIALRLYPEGHATLPSTLMQMGNWKTREHYRFIFRQYTRLDNKLPSVSDPHFPHPSIDDPSKIAYTPDESYGVADRQLVVKPGKYFRMVRPDVSDETIKRWVDLYRERHVPVSDLSGLVFARTREEIRNCFEKWNGSGVASCMTKDLELYATDGIHPCEIYATDDCAIAYLQTDGRTKARCVVDEKEKTWYRIYGDIVEMKKILAKAGYHYSNDSLLGAKLLRLENNDGQIIAPYIDGNGAITIHEDFLLYEHAGDICPDQTNGLLCEERERFYCDRCDTYHDFEDDLHWSEYHNVVYCSNCEGDFTYAYDGRYQEMVLHDVIDVYEYRGSYYTQEGLDFHDLVLWEDEVYSLDDCAKCHFTDELMPMDEMNSAEANGETIFFDPAYADEAEAWKLEQEAA